MKTRFFILLVAVLAVMPLAASATSILPTDFTDVRDTATRSALRVMRERGAVSSAGKFYLARKVNRAEFAKMIVLAGYPHTKPEYQNSCFADVPSTAWYAPWACILQSNGLTGYDAPNSELRLFKPSQNVTYAEAVKMMLIIFDVDTCPASGDRIWYEPCFNSLQAHGLPVRYAPYHELTRAETVRFLHEMLLKFDPSPALSSTSSSSLSSSSSSSSKPLSSSSSSVSKLPLDPNVDTTIRSQFLLLGEVGPVLGAATMFIEEEPLDVTAISVNITAVVSSVQSLLVYDDDKRYLGRATLNPSSTTNRNYRLTLAPGTLVPEKRQERKVYFRAQVSPFQSGGQGGYVVQIANVTVEGNGVWSSRKYTKPTSVSESFPSFVTTRSTITKVQNALDPTGSLVSGTNQRIAGFTFEGRKTDASAHIDLTDLTFQIEQTGIVTLQNVRLGSAGMSETHSCSVTSSTVVCSGIPDLYGSLTDAPRTLFLYADILPLTDVHASLRLTLNAPGDPLSSGAVTWTDGSTSFSWVALDQPVASGTYWKR